MNAFVTGASGFVGTHLLRLLQTEHLQIFTHGPVKGIVGKHYDTPVHDLQALVQVVSNAKPDFVFHVAGIVDAENYPDFYLVNTLYAANLLQALDLTGRKECPALLVGTSAEYGMIGSDQLPITEETPAQPYSHYGVSKLAQTQLGLTLAQSGRKLVMVRPFNIIGRGMGNYLSVKSFARQVAEILVGVRPPAISVGNLSSSRDFVDVEEVVRIYWELIQTPAAYGQVINICSGKPIIMNNLLQKLIALSAMPIEIRTDTSLFRPIDVPVHYGSPGKLRTILGMVPKKSIDETLKEILDDLLISLQNDQP
jgi:GDP-4-dehydro-6-deoxy-D-mannose reductase